MSGRRSTQATSVQAPPASIPKSIGRQSQSPARRTTRSQSAPKNSRTTRRATREASVESYVSAKSYQSRRTRKAAPGLTHEPELQVVSEEEHVPAHKYPLAPTREDDQDEYSNESTALNIHQSPGAMSQMSGTTAVTSFSEATGRDMDPEVADQFSEFYKVSCKIINLLAPPNMNEKRLESILKDVKLPLSKTAKKLKENEDIWQALRDNFPKEEYITPKIVLRVLLGGDFGVGDFRPDAIIYAGNLAYLVKEFVVNEQRSQRMEQLLHTTDTFFPEPFVAGFDTSTTHGKSRLADDSFQMALAVRTQYAILELRQFCVNHKKDTPERILASIFGEPTDLKNPMRGGPANTPEQNKIITHRMSVFRSTFHQDEDAVEQGDLVDIGRLEESFPWSSFLLELVQWSSSRLKEIQQSVTKQGGEDKIQELLLKFIRNNDSQNRANTPPRPGQPALGSPVKVKKGQGRLIAGLKRKRTTDTSTVSLDSRQPAPSGRTTVNKQVGPSAVPEHEARREFENHQPGNGDDDAPFSDSDDASPSDTAKASMEHWNLNVREKNKENLPVTEAGRSVKKRRMIDPHPGDHKITWEEHSQGSSNSRSESRQNSRRPVIVESEDSEDEGFEQDKRAPNPRKRVRVQHRREPSVEIEQATASNSRQRSTEPQAARPRDEDHAARRRQKQEEARLQASARDGDDEDDDDDESVVAFPATAAIARKLARMNTAMAKAARPAAARGRSYWSPSDEQELVRMIEKHGCAWSVIERKARFDVERNQVQLKDKARNMKVNFIKAKVDLPYNFDQVTIGKKELAIIRRFIPEYEED
ncbi:hypothetical protein HYALB_00008845 [Hymenoscyphus albidus]|uniref:Myb-like domain-containing protein n=1 Tax=Hymenoscyphus albidus TaxID=595503 RepID=A0A9N9Q6G7_9HELO|nr:hypothetical protein HYALB_00008845 [Hymenoscyphus albidus]